MARELPRYKNCLICGDENEIGLKLVFTFADGKARTTFVPSAGYEGFKGILHGGIQAAILDEVMIKAVFAEDVLAVTSGLEIRYRRAADIGRPHFAEGWVVARKGRLYETEGRILNDAGEIVAEGRGTFLRVKPEMAERLNESLESRDEPSARHSPVA
jgi:acyl-coenzyme A thioesterase PaaI-like protein